MLKPIYKCSVWNAIYTHTHVCCVLEDVLWISRNVCGWWVQITPISLKPLQVNSLVHTHVLQVCNPLEMNAITKYYIVVCLWQKVDKCHNRL